jgi:hypothetical protein
MKCDICKEETEEMEVIKEYWLCEYCINHIVKIIKLAKHMNESPMYFVVKALKGDIY